MELPYKIIDYKGSKINLFWDEDPERPDEWDDGVCFLIYDHRDLLIEVDGYDPQEIFDEYWSEEKEKTPEHWIIPVYALIHSGITLSLSRRFGGVDPGGWDTSFKGFILRKRGRGVTKKRARQDAQAVIDAWNTYLSGEVCGYVIDDDGDSCWGYYEEKYAIQEAKEQIDYLIQESNEPVIAHTS